MGEYNVTWQEEEEEEEEGAVEQVEAGDMYELQNFTKGFNSELTCC